MYSVFRMAKDEKMWNKPTESGTRWQTAGTFAVDGQGVVRWGGPAKAADDLPDLKEALAALGFGEVAHAKQPANFVERMM
jgi:hypothetical protein